MCKARLARAVSETGCREQRTFTPKLSANRSPTVTGTPRALPARSQDSSAWDCCVPLNRSSSNSSVGRSDAGSEYTVDGVVPAIDAARRQRQCNRSNVVLPLHGGPQIHRYSATARLSTNQVDITNAVTRQIDGKIMLNARLTLRTRWLQIATRVIPTRPAACRNLLS